MVEPITKLNFGINLKKLYSIKFNKAHLEKFLSSQKRYKVK